MAEVSRNVVAILLVLVIAVSGFGTYSLVARDQLSYASDMPSGNTGGSAVTLEIGEKPAVDGTVALIVAPGQ